MRPLILDFKVAREVDPNPISYTYDNELSMNVILRKGEKIAIIDLNSCQEDIGTGTRMQREHDDHVSFSALGTETKIAREHSDYHSKLLDLKTKTLVNRESDDDRFGNYE